MLEFLLFTLQNFEDSKLYTRQLCWLITLMHLSSNKILHLVSFQHSQNKPHVSTRFSSENCCPLMYGVYNMCRHGWYWCLINTSKKISHVSTVKQQEACAERRQELINSNGMFLLILVSELFSVLLFLFLISHKFIRKC